MTNKFFTKEDIKGWGYMLLQNVDQLSSLELSDLMYNCFITYDPNKDHVIMMFSVDTKHLAGDLYLTFPRDLLGQIKDMTVTESFFERNLVGFGFIPNPIEK